MATLSRLFIHPVKSMRGIGVSHALADMSGFAFDRIFMVTEKNTIEGKSAHHRAPVPADGSLYPFPAS